MNKIDSTATIISKAKIDPLLEIFPGVVIEKNG